MAKSRDLFDESTMSFGEHLEVLRVHLWSAIIGLLICVIIALVFSDRVVAVIRRPIDDALQERGLIAEEDAENMPSLWETLESYYAYFFGDAATTGQADKDASQTDSDATAAAEDPEADELDRSTIEVQIGAARLAGALHELDAEKYPAPDPESEDRTIALEITSPLFQQFQQAVEDAKKPIVLTVQEAFMTYLKVAFVTGFVIASPWVFYQLWLFVAAGLYQHERKYIYYYLPMSIVLFMGGAAFCFFGVFPFVLSFLLGFADMLGTTAQIRLSEWISFAIMLPVMFGLSFQLPLVMLFLERISIFEASDYRDKRRMSILVIAVISMFMTPADPMSMLMMMMPLLALYELGILMCSMSPIKNPMEPEPV